MTDQSMDAPSLFFLSSLPISAGSSIDLFLFLTLAPVFSAQGLGIKEMSKSLLQAARLQKQNKVLAARTPLAPRARVYGLVWRCCVELLCFCLQAGVRASPKARKKFDATEVRRSSRAKTTVSYKDDVSSSLDCM